MTVRGILPSSVQVDLNTRRLKLVSTSGHVIFCLLLDIDEVPGERFLGLIVE